MAVIENELMLKETSHNYGDTPPLEHLQCFHCGGKLIYPFIYWRGAIDDYMRYACFHPGCAADVVMGLSCDIHHVKHITNSGLVFMQHDQTKPEMLMPQIHQRNQ
jgi:hypothetical protein